MYAEKRRLTFVFVSIGDVSETGCGGGCCCKPCVLGFEGFLIYVPSF